MFAIDCPTHRSQVLVPVSRIRSLDNNPDGIVVVVECWCETRVPVHTGRRASGVVTGRSTR
jgi:hypothetical protein